MNSLPHGIYEQLLDEALQEALELLPEQLRRVFSKIDPKEQSAAWHGILARITSFWMDLPG